MQLNTRIIILIGLACAVAAVLYFRILGPPQVNPSIAVDFEQGPVEPFEMVINNPPSDVRAKAVNVVHKVVEPTRRLAAPASDKPKPPAPTAIVNIPLVVAAEPEAPAEPVVVQVKPKPAKPKPRTYIVKSGDSLWKIARDQLGDASRHLELARINDSTLHGDPDNLRPGQKLILPAK